MDSRHEPALSKKISMRTIDDVLFEVDLAVAMEMETLKSFLEENDTRNTIVFPLPNVKSKTMKKIIDYIKTHIELKEKAKMCVDENDRRVSGCNEYGNFTGQARAYDNEYLAKLSDDEIKELLLAANYLNAKEVLELLFQGVADRIKDRSVEDTRKFLGIEEHDD